MAGLLAPLLTPLRRLGALGRRAPGEPSPDAPSPPARRLARRMADSLERAMSLGLWDHADRLARASANLVRGNARLVEPLARLRLAQGDPETALRVIDTCGELPASLRMLRIVCLLFLGARAEADLDLHRWSQQAAAPLDCRLLAGLLERHRDPEAALRVLQRNLRHLEDPRTLQALLMLSIFRDRPQQADLWAQRLRRCGHVDALGTDLLLLSLGMPGLRADDEPSAEQVHALSMELIAFEPAIEALVEAQRLQPDLHTVRLLRRAIEGALGDLAEPDEALRALARLAAIEGDLAAARRYAQRGLERNPMSASLALLLRELTEPPPPDPAGAVALPRAREIQAAPRKAA